MLHAIGDIVAMQLLHRIAARGWIVRFGSNPWIGLSPGVDWVTTKGCGEDCLGTKGIGREEQ